MFTTDDLGKLILLSYWGPMLLLMAFALWAVWKWLPFGKAAKAVAALAVLVAVPALFILPLFQVVKADKKKEDEYQQRYQAAKAVFDRVAHEGCLNAPNIQYRQSPYALFNGDLLLAAHTPSGDTHLLLADFTGHGLPAAIGAMPLAEVFYSMTAKG